MPLDERRVISSDLRIGTIGMVKKIQVVNSHDLRCVAGGNEQRVWRVNDVEAGTRHHFNRWPLEPMPAVVEHRNRDPSVDFSDCWWQRLGQPILPRTGEDGQLDGVVDLGQRCHEPVDPFTNTCAGPEGRPIIDQDTHVRLGVMVAQRGPTFPENRSI
jgi:hypothetical protein